MGSFVCLLSCFPVFFFSFRIYHYTTIIHIITFFYFRVYYRKNCNKKYQLHIWMQKTRSTMNCVCVLYFYFCFCVVFLFRFFLRLVSFFVFVFLFPFKLPVRYVPSELEAPFHVVDVAACVGQCYSCFRQLALVVAVGAGL